MSKDKKFSHYIKKLTPKSIFSSTVLIFIFLLAFSLVYLFSNHHLVNTYESFSSAFVVAAVFLMLKAFVLSYTGIVDNIRQNRSVLLILNIVLFAMELSAAFFVVTSLTVDGYVKNPIGGLLTAAIIVTVHAVLNGFSKIIKFAIYSILIYTFLFVTIDMSLFPANGQIWNFLSDVFNNYKYWNLISKIAIFTEIVSLYIVTKNFFEKVRD